MLGGFHALQKIRRELTLGIIPVGNLREKVNILELAQLPRFRTKVIRENTFHVLKPYRLEGRPSSL
jgi:hypothetical protein